MDESNRFGVKLKAPKGTRIVPSQAEKLSPQRRSGVDIEAKVPPAGNKISFEKKTHCLRKVNSNEAESNYPEVALNIDLLNQFNQLTNPGEKTKEVVTVDKQGNKKQSRRRSNSIQEVRNTFGVELKTASIEVNDEEVDQPKCITNSNTNGEVMMPETEMEEELNLLEGRIKESRRRSSSVEEVKNTFGVELKATLEKVNEVRKEIQLQSFQNQEDSTALGKDVPADDISSDEEEEFTLQRTQTILLISKKYEGGGRKLSSIDVSQSDKPAPIEEESETADDPELQKLREKKASRCWHAVQEIMTSEKSYVDILKILDEFTKRVESKITKTSEEGVRIYQMSLFTILPQLLMLNSHLLDEFETRINNWTTHKKIADVFVKKGDFLKIYSAYMDTFEQTSSIFQECERKFQGFAKIVKEIERLPLCQGLGLQGHMLAPVQRLPRYKMLLETYLKYQEENAEDFEDTKNALRTVISVTNASNKRLHEKDMMNKMKQLQKRFGSEYELVRAARSLLKEGRLANVTIWEVPQPCHAILVTDSLLIAYPKVTIVY